MKDKRPEPPKKPKEPVLPHFHTPAKIPHQFKQLDVNDRTVYQQALSDHRWQYKMYEKAHRGMVEYRKFLARTVNTSYLGPNDEESPPDTMRRLQGLFLSPQMLENLRMEFHKTGHRPQSAAEPDAKWIFDWLNLARRVVRRVVHGPIMTRSVLCSLLGSLNPGGLQDALRNDGAD